MRNMEKVYEKQPSWEHDASCQPATAPYRLRSPANRASSPTIIVSPHVGLNGRRHPSDFDCWLEGGQFLCISRQPFLQAARVLKAMGYDPHTTLLMRHAGSDVVALRGRLGIAAGLTVDEYNGTRFAPWKPFPGLAGSSGIEKSQQGGAK